MYQARKAMLITGCVVSIIGSKVAAEEPDYAPEVEFHGEILGGFYADEALKASAGRETQVWKMTRVLFGADVALGSSPWSARIELVPLADEVEYREDDAAYVDYYKNLGTELLYYGDYPVREAFARYQRRYVTLTAGRVVNLYGIPIDEAPYEHRHEAPHGYYLDKELVNGAQLDLHGGGLNLSLGVFGGRGNPGLSYNHYLDGNMDPNTKDNNTPIFEGKLSYTLSSGGFSGSLYSSYHYTKTGSAPGTLYDGKHNDERMNIGVDLRWTTGLAVLSGLRLLGQYHQYTFGLTESGVQGERTPDRSFDIDKQGYFATLSAEFFERMEFQYTYEMLDRMDTRVWDEIANFNPDHEAFDSRETNHIASVRFSIIPNIRLGAFYRLPDYDYRSVSGIRPTDDLEKMGVTLAMGFSELSVGGWP